MTINALEKRWGGSSYTEALSVQYYEKLIAQGMTSEEAAYDTHYKYPNSKGAIMGLKADNKYRTDEEITDMLKYETNAMKNGSYSERQTADDEMLSAAESSGMNTEEANKYVAQNTPRAADPAFSEGTSGPIASFASNILGPVSEIVDEYITTPGEKRDAIDDAEQKQMDALSEQNQMFKDMFDQGREDTRITREAGDKQIGLMEEGLDSGAYTPDPFQFDESQHEMPGEFSFTYEDFENTPYYQFLQESGAKAIDRGAASGGGLGSGATLSALQNRGQAIAGQEFGNQYNRAADTYGTNYNRAAGERQFGYGQSVDDYNRDATQKNQLYNERSNLAGLGQVGLTSQMSANQGYTSNMGSNIMNQGNVGANAAMGRANTGYDPFDILNTGLKLYGAFGE